VSQSLADFCEIEHRHASIRPCLRGSEFSIAIRIRSAVREAELVLHVAAIIRHGLVAEANRIGDLQQAVTFAEKPENLEIAACQVVEGMR
jgi:hypothetical protein